MNAKAFCAFAFASILLYASQGTAQVAPGYDSPIFPDTSSIPLVPDTMPDTGPQWQQSDTPFYSTPAYHPSDSMGPGPIEANPGGDLPTYPDMNSNTDPISEPDIIIGE